MTDAAYPFSSSLSTFYHCIIFLKANASFAFHFSYLNDTLDELLICPDKIHSVAPLDERWDQFQR